MSKKHVVFSIIAVLIVLGLIICVVEFETKKIKHTPLISYKTPLNTEVQTISFERNSLNINDMMYSAGGISWYSEYKDSVSTLDQVKPPFRLFKFENNDTLQIIKDGKQFIF
jgi:hypothetical protein